MSNQSPFKWRHFEAEIILLCVRWYLRYSLSYRDLEEMMVERGLTGLPEARSRQALMTEKEQNHIPSSKECGATTRKRRKPVAEARTTAQRTKPDAQRLLFCANSVWS